MDENYHISQFHPFSLMLPTQFKAEQQRFSRINAKVFMKMFTSLYQKQREILSLTPPNFWM